MSRARKTFVTLLLIVLVLGSIWTLRARMLPEVLWWLDVGKDPQPADCALIMGGSQNTRPWVAAALYRAGLVRRVLVTRIAPTAEVADRLVPPWQEITRGVLLHRGVPSEAIELIGHDCHNTFHEAEALRGFLQTSPETRVLVVTSSFHTRRVRWTMRRVLGDQSAQVVVVSAPEDGVSPHDWWQSRQGFQLVAAEYCKLAFYHLRYGWAGYGLAATAVLIGVLGWWLGRRRRAAA